MKHQHSVHLITLLLLYFCIVALPLPSGHPLISTKPVSLAQPKTLAIAGLRDWVTVRRDERGIPYIEAKNDEDLYFAQGYVTASDRLWQMDLLRRTERGELAEVLGV